MGKPVVLIVGSGPRLGEAVARRFGRDGYDVALVARNPDRLAELAARLQADGITAGWARADVADGDALSTAARRFLDRTGRIDVVLHNVSIFRAAAATQLTPEQLVSDLAAGVASLLSITRAVVPAMIAAGSGTVLATGSRSADVANPLASSLGVQKAALRSLVSELAADLAPQGVHCATVTVNGAIAEGTRFDPARIADVFADLVAETSGPREQWRTIVPFDG